MVAGVERHELAGGEVVRARNEDGDTVRFGASGEARGGAARRAEHKDSAP